MRQALCRAGFGGVNTGLMQESPRRGFEFFIIIGDGEMLGCIYFPGRDIATEGFAISVHGNSFGWLNLCRLGLFCQFILRCHGDALGRNPTRP